MLGTNKDEVSWTDISTYATKTLNTQGNVVFLTPYERAQLTNDEVEILQDSGKRVVLVTDSIKNKLNTEITTFDNVMQEYRESFTYNYIDYSKLTAKEKETYDTSHMVLTFLKSKKLRSNIPIKVSETIQLTSYGERADGLWNGENIIIRRDVLSNKLRFLGVLAHEYAHAISGSTDNTRQFESCLTDIIGHLLYDKSLLENAVATSEKKSGTTAIQ